MTDNGGERRDSGAGDSWFKPSENRYRTQSEYQDPLEGEEDGETVFPDSGGYTGLSSSRPALVEPYPEALGGPPPAAPGISYPGAGASAYQPLTRIPGEREDPGLPGVAASARVPLPEEQSAEGPRTQPIPVPGDGDAPEREPSPWEAEPLHDTAGSGQPWGDTGATASGGGTGSGARSSSPERSGADEQGGAPASSGWEGPSADAEPRPWEPAAPGGGYGSAARDSGGLGGAADSGAPWQAPASDAGQPWDASVPGAGSSGTAASGRASWDDTRPAPGADHGSAGSGYGYAEQGPGFGASGSPSWEGPSAYGSADRGDDELGGDSWEASGSGADQPWASGDGGHSDTAWGTGSDGRESADQRPWDASAPRSGTADADETRWDDAPASPAVPEGGAWSPSADRPWADEQGGAPAPSGWDGASADARSWEPGASGAEYGSAPGAPEGRGGAVDGGASWDTGSPATAWDDTGASASSGWDGASADARSWEPGAPGAEYGSAGYGERDSGAAGDQAAEGASIGWRVDVPEPGEAPWDDGAASAPADRPWADEPGDASGSSWEGSPAPADAQPWETRAPDAPASREPAGGDTGQPWSSADSGVSGAEYGSAGHEGPGGADEHGRAAWGGSAPEIDELGPASWDAPAAGSGQPWAAEDTGSGRAPAAQPWDDDPLAGDGARSRAWDGDELGGDSWSAERPVEDAPARGSDDPLADGAARGRSWDEDELGAGSWGDERPAGDTEGLDSWTPSREEDESWSGSGTNEPWTEGGGSGNTWAFDRNDLRLPDVVREAEQRRRESATGRPEVVDWGAPDTGELSAAVPDSDDPLGAIADMQTRARSRDEESGGATQMFDARELLGDEDDGDPDDDRDWADEEPRDRGYGPDPADEEPGTDRDGEYEDGFTPADYGMPEPAARKRRRDPIADDFPGFDDRPLGGEPGDPYPGYDSIDFLADTERGAMVTLWLGVASLIPGVGLVTALVALLVTGPRAKRAIRDSRGQLDGLGFITAGTVFAVLGILVTVISVALWLVL
ncbi:hypothetical protein [Nocardiopsis sp. FR6]|uniref:hypothetical protein n=1 Tax=Nocardiopsis sp. FR6 TaxID=2605986 RepID=UPI00135C7EEB|nr:hypothetical protein [Nocardiopsis sp. FR6]